MSSLIYSETQKFNRLGKDADQLEVLLQSINERKHLLSKKKTLVSTMRNEISERMVHISTVEKESRQIESQIQTMIADYKKMVSHYDIGLDQEHSPCKAAPIPNEDMPENRLSHKENHQLVQQDISKGELLFKPLAKPRRLTRVYSVDGNIGAGKTTFLEAIRKHVPEVHVILEPVGEWLRLKNDEGVSLLELFYSDKRRWAYSFQNCAILTRLITIRKALDSLPADAVIITERSVLTDRHVFAEMMKDSGNIDTLEWDLYCKWFDGFAADIPIQGIIYLTTSVNTSADRIVTRGRSGEDHIPHDYLEALEKQHQNWVKTTPLPVLEISTEPGVRIEDSIASVKKFIAETPL